ncbi:sporulation kinase E [mine drainage metagenome]|uniref:Sporulation kinase E n=1 Tax=mine drainage metagenome TaxID=410659 RepID=A0A1J5SGU4_9ZZZZ
MKRLPLLLKTPARMAIAVGLFILVGEFLIMLLIDGVFNTLFRGKVSNIFWEFIDPLLLTALVSPAIYLLVFRPIRAQQDLFRRIFETINVGIVLTRGGKLLYANPECERLTGFTRAKLQDMDYWELVHPDMRATMRERVVARQRGDVLTDRYEYRLNTRRGTEIWTETSAAMIDYQGKKTVFASFIDITERKLAEEGLRHTQSDLERLVQRRTAALEQANLQLAQDVRSREDAEAALLRRNAELSELNARLNEAQEQLLQAEKMASIGQLAAGVAHEINNPIGYVQSNIGSLEGYLADLFRILDAYAGAEAALPVEAPACAELRRIKAELDLAFLRQDIPQLMDESKEGISRVRKIVQDLKDFSHVDSSQEWKWADLHKGLDSTLNVVNNEIKYKADVVKEYGELPQVECLPSELNQVFLNLLVNAAHAIPEGERGKISLKSGCDGERVWVEVADTGSGIAPENLKRIFDPFFTTKPVGRGTGLGLSLSYGIVNKHGGRIEVMSELGRGTTFRVILPLRQSHEDSREADQ